MDKKRLTKQSTWLDNDRHQLWIDSFFEKMYQDIRKNKRIYSLVKYIEKNGLTYEQVKEWADLKKCHSELLEHVRMSCLNHAENAAIYGEIPYEDWVKYVYEIDDKDAQEFKEHEMLYGDRKTKKRIKNEDDEKLKKKTEEIGNKFISISITKE